jgi:hypothetical protein
MWIPALEAAGIPYFRPYDLRHTCATLLIYEGRTLNEVAEHLGHADPGFTARVYIHVLRDATKRRRVPHRRGHRHGAAGAPCPAMTEQEVLEAARIAGEWLFDRRERLEKHDREGIALVWLALSEIEGILHGFDVLEAAGALTPEERVLQGDLLDLLSGGNAPLIEIP